MSDRFLDIPDLATYLGVKESWVRERVAARAIPFRKVGKHVRFAPEDVQAIQDGKCDAVTVYGGPDKPRRTPKTPAGRMPSPVTAPPARRRVS